MADGITEIKKEIAFDERIWKEMLGVFSLQTAFYAINIWRKYCIELNWNIVPNAA